MMKLTAAIAITAVALCAFGTSARAEDDAKPAKGKGGMAAMDTDKDGSISKEEYTAAMKEKGKEDADIEKMFTKKDADGDGSISGDEMKAGKKGGAKKDGAKKKKGAGTDAASDAAAE